MFERLRSHGIFGKLKLSTCASRHHSLCRKKTAHAILNESKSMDEKHENPDPNPLLNNDTWEISRSGSCRRLVDLHTSSSRTGNTSP